jgi:uncharacterized membrane protein
MKRVVVFLKRIITYPWNKCVAFYQWIIHVLTKTQCVARFLAHGGTHFILLLILIALGIIMGYYLKNCNVASYNQIEYTFYGDTLGNYKINYLCLKKDMTRRPAESVNVEDIRLDVGYEKIQDTIPDKKILGKIGDKMLDCDLVSKIRYVVRNNLPDTIYTSPLMGYRYYTWADQLSKYVKITNHDRYYYGISTELDTRHRFYRQTDAIDHLIEWGESNPNFSFRIGIIMNDDVKLNNQSKIVIKYNDFVNKDSINRPLVFDEIIPSPTYKNLSEIVYKGDELAQVIKGKGIYISGTDLQKKEKVEKAIFFYTVLIGTIIAFILDVIVQLVLKWRKLKEKK